MTITVIDSVTRLADPDRGAVVIGGSHCGRYAAGVAAVRGARGVVLHDAGVGIDRAGVAGLDLLDEFGIPGATVGWDESCIGDGRSVADARVITHRNATAAAFGIVHSMSAREVAAAMEEAPDVGAVDLNLVESRSETEVHGISVLVLDSVSLVRPGDEGRFVVCASHASILGADVRSACKVDVASIAFNDAGRVDRATRLPALDHRGIAAVAVSNSTARIGDGAHTLENGVISVANDLAAARGAVVGMTVREWIAHTAMEENNQ